MPRNIIDNRDSYLADAVRPLPKFTNQKSDGIRTRPVRRMTQAELDGFLEKVADILRGNVDHSEFRGYVFALLFFKRVSDVYLEEVRILARKLGDAELARDPKMHNFVVPDGCLWLDPADEMESYPQKKKSVARKNA